MVNRKKIYLCDWRKNSECPKDVCWWKPWIFESSKTGNREYYCYSCTDCKYAKTDSHGTPIPSPINTQPKEEQKPLITIDPTNTGEAL